MSVPPPPRSWGRTPEPPNDPVGGIDPGLYEAWCRQRATEETCERYRRVLERLGWSLDVRVLLSLRTKWEKLAVRSLLRFLEEVYGFEVTRLRRLVRLERSKEDKYVPSVEEVKRMLQLPERFRVPLVLIVYSGLRPEHALRLIPLVSTLGVEEIPGGCVRLRLGWVNGPKRAYYAYMPRWLYEELLSYPYDPPRRESLTRKATRSGVPAPKYLRKFALHHMAALLNPLVAAHIAGHDPGDHWLPLPAHTSMLAERYAKIEDIAAQRYHYYAHWLEEQLQLTTST